MDYKQINADILMGVQTSEFAGHDPFDSLNSLVLQKTPLYKNEWVRLAWLQFGKCSPFNFRGLLQVPKKRNPKGVGLFISGLLEDYARSGQQRYLDDAIELGDWLLTQRCNRSIWHYSCWGYHFDWQARAFYVPAGKPNIITTVYVARALLTLGEVSKADRFSEAALDSARFISSMLFTQAEEGGFYAYIPGEQAFVHNASLWGAAWCVVAGQRLSDSTMVSQGMEVARRSVRQQADDGAWVYGALHHHQFIDGFHTGYNLEALDLIRKCLATSEFDEAIDKGLSFYKNHFFLDDGAAKYYHNNPYPLDTHTVAQAVFTLLKVGGEADDLRLCEKVLKRAMETLYLPDKCQFVYQKTRWFTNKINYTRWTQAWVYYALAFYNRYTEELNNHATD